MLIDYIYIPMRTVVLKVSGIRWLPSTCESEGKEGGGRQERKNERKKERKKGR